MYQICVSGAAKGKSLEEGRTLARAAGKTIATHGHGLMTGATVGLPHEAAVAYKANHGKMSLGISPAATKIEHVFKYHLPTEPYDSIIYSGLHYIGRDALLITSSDAVISIGGRLGTLHEFAIAMESDTPIAFLLGAGGITDEVHQILAAAEREEGKDVLFGTDPDALFKELIELLNKRNQDHISLYR